MANLSLSRREAPSIKIEIESICIFLVVKLNQHTVAVFQSIIPDDPDARGTVGVGAAEAEEVVSGEAGGDGKDEKAGSSPGWEERVGEGVEGRGRAGGAIKVDDSSDGLDSERFFDATAAAAAACAGFLGF